MKYLKFLFLFLLAFTSFAPNLTKEVNIKTSSSVSFSQKIEAVYNSIDSNNFNMPNLESFSKALQGYYLLKEDGKVKNDFLTIIDFSMSSREKRCWVIDVDQNKIIYNSLVAHGQNSGEDYAQQFSNRNNSYQSCLGFFTTGEIYSGKHGMSMKLDGLEKGINDNARQRSIVVHGADYVSNSFIRNHSRLGRSQGCPAVSSKLSGKVIDVISDKTVLFINSTNQNYNSKYLDATLAANVALNQQTDVLASNFD